MVNFTPLILYVLEGFLNFYGMNRFVYLFFASLFFIMFAVSLEYFRGALTWIYLFVSTCYLLKWIKK